MPDAPEPTAEMRAAALRFLNTVGCGFESYVHNLAQIFSSREAAARADERESAAKLAEKIGRGFDAPAVGAAIAHAIRETKE